MTLEEGLPLVKQAWKSINCQGVLMTNLELFDFRGMWRLAKWFRMRMKESLILSMLTVYMNNVY